jgi:uncharacterized Zn finger protein
MFFQDLTFWGKTRGVCPACDAETVLAMIVRHPVRGGLELHTFDCDKCGPIKPRIVSMPSYQRPSVWVVA